MNTARETQAPLSMPSKATQASMNIRSMEERLPAPMKYVAAYRRYDKVEGETEDYYCLLAIFEEDMSWSKYYNPNDPQPLERYLDTIWMTDDDYAEFCGYMGKQFEAMNPTEAAAKMSNHGMLPFEAGRVSEGNYLDEFAERFGFRAWKVS